MAESQNWSDLTVRVTSGIAMIVVGVTVMWMGGFVFQLSVALICGLMVWELVGMLRPGVRHEQLQFGVLAGLALLVAVQLPVWLGVIVLLGTVGAGYTRIPQNKEIFAGYALVILFAGVSLLHIRDGLGFGWLLWLVLVVVMTDVAGYFAGRSFGGPKFWPAISPKKTWSGTVAGWVGAAVVGVIFSIDTGIGVQIVVVSILISFASQLGDIAESAIKRKTGVKDSSSLIPGHGGLMDRFDGMLGAAVFVFIINMITGFPAGLG